MHKNNGLLIIDKTTHGARHVSAALMDAVCGVIVSTMLSVENIIIGI
jgi:hypothetical protein